MSTCCRTMPLAELLASLADDLGAWARAAGGRLTLAESPRAALDTLASGSPTGGFAAALFFEGDQGQAEYSGDSQCRGTLTIALLRHPGLAANKMEGHIRDGQRPALLTLVDGLRAHVAGRHFEALPNGCLEYDSARYLQLSEGALANGYALTFHFTYFHRVAPAATTAEGQANDE